jgi:hypothetical protein
MNKRQTKIRDYVRSLTRGIVSLKESHINEIMKIAGTPDDNFKVILYKKNFVTEAFDVMKTKMVSEEKVQKVLKSVESRQSVNGFYRYDVFNEESVLIKQIYSVNSLLF